MTLPETESKGLSSRGRTRAEERAALLAAQRAWMSALGVSEQPAADPAAATASLRRLEQDVAAERLSGRARLDLVELFGQLITCICQAARWPADLPVLYHAPARAPVGLGSRPLRWGLLEDVWVASSPTDRENLRRIFPGLPLLASEPDARQRAGTPLAARVLDVRATLGSEQRGQPDERAAAVIRTHLPALLALTDASPRYLPPIEPEEIQQRWDRLSFVRHVDVWWEWSVSGPAGVEPVAPRRERYDDVMIQPLEGGRFEISFDVDPRSRRDLPPLSNFAEALALALLDATAAPDLLEGLAAADAGRLESLIERHQLRDSRDRLRLQLRPLAASEQDTLNERAAQVLAGLGLALRRDGSTPRSLTPADLVDRPHLRGADVTAALAAAEWTPRQRAFVPRFDCGPAHLESWQRWVSQRDRRARMLRWAWEREHAGEPPRRAELSAAPLARDLERFIRACAGWLDFAPAHAAAGWLARFGDPPTVDALPALPTYAAVTMAPDTAGACALSLTDGSPAARAGRDRGAEQALLAWAEAQTLPLLTGPLLTGPLLTGPLLTEPAEDGWTALLSCVPGYGAARERLLAARAEGTPLAEALHVSARGDSLGFDVLGLESDADGAPLPARYAVKALPTEAGCGRVFVSSKELSAWRAARGAERCVWRLLGITPPGQAIELTQLLDPVSDLADGWPGASGLAPSSVVLGVRWEPQPV